MTVLVINPNGTAATTAMMVSIAQDTEPMLTFEGFTNEGAPPIITDEPGLAQAIARLSDRLNHAAWRPAEAIVIAAFADPCLDLARARFPCPVTGIAEAGMAAAAAGGRRFAIATNTPGLERSIRSLAEGYGHVATYAGLALTTTSAPAIMADPRRLEEELLAACRHAVAELGADAVLIGGGPLALAARAIADALPVPLIEPVPEAARLTRLRIQSTGLSRSPGSSHPS